MKLERYLEWNAAIIEEYFPDGDSDRYAVLPIDDDEIVELASEYNICSREDAVEDFVRSVRLLLSTGHGGFAVLSRGAKTWRAENLAEPPYVGGLAFCVLAASRMESRGAVASHNYYVRLNELLGQDPLSGIPHNFDLVRNSWVDLDRWLNEDCQGNRGQSSVRLDGSRNIGPPISQCLLRAVDRRRLPDFFAQRGLQPDDSEEIGDRRLFAMLKAWAHRPSCQLSSRAIQAITSAEGRDLEEIVETVKRELSVWDGSLRDRRGRRRYPLRLKLRVRGKRTKLQLLAELPDAFESGSWRREDTGIEVSVERDPDTDGWSLPIVEAAVSDSVLSRGLTISNGDIAFVLDPLGAFPFREDDALIGHFLSQRQTVLWEPHYLVVRNDLRDAAVQYLSRLGDDTSVVSHSELPKGWSLVGPFEFKDQPAQPPYLELAHLAPRQLRSLSFRGGLRIDPNDWIYLSGGEPDVLVSFDDELSVPTLTVDDLPVPLGGGGSRIRLRDLKPRLGAGVHSVASDVTRQFTTIETHGEVRPFGSGARGLLFERHQEYKPMGEMADLVAVEPARSELIVSGAEVRAADEDRPQSRKAPFFFKGRFSSCMVLGEIPGQIAIASVQAPGWMEKVGLGSRFQMVEVVPDFVPVWHLFESSDGDKGVARILGDPTPELPRAKTAGAWFDAVFAWSEAEVLDSSDRDAWQAFVKSQESTYDPEVGSDERA